MMKFVGNLPKRYPKLLSKGLREEATSEMHAYMREEF
jgi:hypothetical protein